MNGTTTKWGVPYWSRSMIEIKAEEVIEYFRPKVLESPTPTPMDSIIEQSIRDFSLKFDLTSDLGKTASGKRILGRFTFRPRAIQIDGTLINDSRYNFTLAHEFGHLVLHRKVKVKQSGGSIHEINDTKHDLVTGHKILSTPRDWLEWQANYFSAALLIPRATIHNEVFRVQQRMDIRINLGRVILESKKYSYDDFDRLLTDLCRTYDVSKTAMKYRLEDLGILIDLRDKDIKHISELLRED